VNGKPVRGFMGMVDSVTWHVVSSRSDLIDFLVKRPGEAEPRQASIFGWPRNGQTEYQAVTFDDTRYRIATGTNLAGTVFGATVASRILVVDGSEVTPQPRAW